LSQKVSGGEAGKQAKKVIEGIERIHWETTTCTCFVGSTIAAMRNLGEEIADDYVMGISGAAFKMFWEMPWSPANCDLLLIGEEPVRRTFAMLGYDYAFIPDPRGSHDVRDSALAKESFRKKIVDSIDKGRPVIAQGVIGPPECCVIAGYGGNGDVLYGWSYFQEDPKGYFFTDRWFENCHGLIIIGEKKQTPSRRQILQNTLEWAIKLARTPEFDRHVMYEEWGGGVKPSRVRSGFAAYGAYAEALVRDGDFPADNAGVLADRLNPIANDGIYIMECKRERAGRFLASMADEGHAGAGELRKASELYAQVAGAWRKASAIIPWDEAFEEKCRKIADPSFRRKLSAISREAKAHEEEAVEQLEFALKELTAH
jgi:hypothetical protein